MKSIMEQTIIVRVLVFIYLVSVVLNIFNVFHSGNDSQGRSQDFSKGGHRGYSPAALHRVSAGSVVLSRHEGPY